MKKIKKLMISIGAISIIGAMIIGCNSGKENSKVEESDWEEINSPEFTHKSYIGGFLNEDFGITVGYAGEVHYTTDGGKTWPQGTNKSYCRFGMDIVNEKVAYNCGNASHVRKTLDGGENWIEVSNFGESEPNQCRYLRFIDENKGWIASPKKLGATKDGGNTWEEINLPNSGSKILAIDLVNENNGYIVSTDKKLYVTKDGGKSFDAKDITMDDFDDMVYSTNQIAIKFTSENKGEIFYYGPEGKLKGYVTEDDGQTWEEEKIPDIEECGPLYISNDGKYLSVNGNNASKIIVLRRK